MGCMEHRCDGCKQQWWDNEMYKECPYCKNVEVTNWFDEIEEVETNDDYEDDI